VLRLRFKVMVEKSSDVSTSAIVSKLSSGGRVATWRFLRAASQRQRSTGKALAWLTPQTNRIRGWKGISHQEPAEVHLSKRYAVDRG
jgi:hypothetical protein